MIGKSVPRVDAYDKVIGRAKFTDDPSNSNHVSIEVTIGNQVYPLSFQLKH